MATMRARAAAWLERPGVGFLLVVLILFSAATVPLETLPGLSPGLQRFLSIAEIVVVAIFTAEYLLRLWVAERRWRFATSMQGIIDLLAILPFYLAFAIDLRAVRLLRVFRLLRLLKLARYDRAFNRIWRALMESREELAISLLVLGMAVYFAAFCIFHFEHAAQPDKFVTIADGLWWAVATVTTVGYGDIYPITAGGRLFTFLLLIVSLGLVAAPAGIFASALLSIRNDEKRIEARQAARADDELGSGHDRDIAPG